MGEHFEGYGPGPLRPRPESNNDTGTTKVVPGGTGKSSSNGGTPYGPSNGFHVPHFEVIPGNELSKSILRDMKTGTRCLGGTVFNTTVEGFPLIGFALNCSDEEAKLHIRHYMSFSVPCADQHGDRSVFLPYYGYFHTSEGYVFLFHAAKNSRSLRTVIGTLNGEERGFYCNLGLAILYHLMACIRAYSGAISDKQYVPIGSINIDTVYLSYNSGEETIYILPLLNLGMDHGKIVKYDVSSCVYVSACIINRTEAIRIGANNTSFNALNPCLSILDSAYNPPNIDDVEKALKMIYGKKKPRIITNHSMIVDDSKEYEEPEEPEEGVDEPTGKVEKVFASVKTWFGSIFKKIYDLLKRFFPIENEGPVNEEQKKNDREPTRTENALIRDDRSYRSVGSHDRFRR